MKINDFLTALTGVIVIAMQTACITALAIEKLTFQEYIQIWAPILTLIIGYWFRGTQTMVAQP